MLIHLQQSLFSDQTDYALVPTQSRIGHTSSSPAYSRISFGIGGVPACLLLHINYRTPPIPPTAKAARGYCSSACAKISTNVVFSVAARLRNNVFNLHTSSSSSFGSWICGTVTCGASFCSKTTRPGHSFARHL